MAPDSSLVQEEIFGPVLAVIKVRDLTHALEVANGTPYALTGGLYSRSPEHIARVKREFRVGNLYINRKVTGALVDRQPFGGFKLSGIGAKADAALKGATGKSGGELFDQAKTFATENKAATGAALGGLGLLLLGTRGGRGLVGVFLGFFLLLALLVALDVLVARTTQ